MVRNKFTQKKKLIRIKYKNKVYLNCNTFAPQIFSNFSRVCIMRRTLYKKDKNGESFCYFWRSSACWNCLFCWSARSHNAGRLAWLCCHGASGQQVVLSTCSSPGDSPNEDVAFLQLILCVCVCACAFLFRLTVHLYSVCVWMPALTAI